MTDTDPREIARRLLLNTPVITQEHMDAATEIMPKAADALTAALDRAESAEAQIADLQAMIAKHNAEQAAPDVMRRQIALRRKQVEIARKARNAALREIDEAIGEWTASQHIAEDMKHGVFPNRTTQAYAIRRMVRALAGEHQP